MPSTSTPPPRRPAKGPPPAPRKGKSPPPRSDSTGPLGFFANNSQYCLTPANSKSCSAAVAGKSADSGDPEVSSKPPPSMKKGGMVKKTGLYKLHKGELVVPTRNVTKVKKALKS